MADLCECLFPFFGSHRINEENFSNETKARMRARGHLPASDSGTANQSDSNSEVLAAAVVTKTKTKQSAQIQIHDVPQAYAVPVSVPASAPPSYQPPTLTATVLGEKA